MALAVLPVIGSHLPAALRTFLLTSSWWTTTQQRSSRAVFALLSAGVTIGGPAGPRASLSDRVAAGVVVALVVGKGAGVSSERVWWPELTRAEPDDELARLDAIGPALRSGIGLTVSPLIGELAYVFRWM